MTKTMYTILLVAMAAVLAIIVPSGSAKVYPYGGFMGDNDTQSVCGNNNITYPDKYTARALGGGVMHCGLCGACSNKHDIDIYLRTRENLTQVTRRCAFLSTFSYEKSRQCVKENVGFTESCLDCWMANILCDRKLCYAVCLKSMLLDEPYVDENGNLNDCLQCDEDKCGPAFVACAGANRRRACIHSDIMRDENAICKDCDQVY